MSSSFGSWKTFANSFVSVLDLQGQPISITYSNEEVQATIDKSTTVCKALKLAQSGEIISLNKTNCTCPGGKWHIGFGKKKEDLERILVEGEKLWATVAIARQSIGETHRIAPPPVNLAKYVVFSPLNKAALRPDLVVILANPWQASRLIFLADYHGFPIRPNVTGSLCWGAITYPIVTGNFNITMGDPTARRRYKYSNNELIVSIPYRMVPAIMEAIEYSTAGKGKVAEWFEQRTDMRE